MEHSRMFLYLLSFLFGIYVSQEYNVPNVKKTTEDIMKIFKK